MTKTYMNFSKTIASLSLALLAFSAKAQTVVTFTYTGAIEQFTVPALCVPTITIQAKGAQGGFNTASTISSGLGADMKGVFSVTAGQVLKILVGQQPSNTASNGGGGGTFVTDLSNNPLIIAGGGGGSAGAADIITKHGQAGTAGGQGAGNTGGTGGINGNGGNIGTNSYNSAAGGGLLTNGASGSPGVNSGGYAFVNGGAAGAPLSAGFGGYGGGGTGSLNYVGGGGGGYSGGGGGSNTGGVGGGGGSYNGGTNQVNTGGSNSGNGVVIISYQAGLPVTVNASANAICNGSSVTFSASGMVTYTWLPVGSFAGSNSAVITVTPNTTTTYSVTGTSASGCPGSAAVTVTVNAAAPILTVSSSSPSVCLGNTVSLTASGALSYTWSGGVSNGVAFSPNATAQYSVSGGNGCGTTSSVVTISVSALPVTASATSTLVCASTAATLSAGGAASYTWMPGTNTQTNYIVNPSAGTVYTVTGRTGNCSGVATITISTKANPTLTILATNTVICDGDATSLTAGGAVTYTWNPVVSNALSITVSPTVSTLYSVTGTNSNNCTASTSQVILVRPKPVVNATASDDLVCVGGASTLTASGANTYLWSNNAGTTVTVVNPTQTTTYSVTGTSTAGCISGTVVTVSVFDPTLTVSSATAICRGTAVNISAGGMDSYQWSTGSVFSSISVSPTTTTTYSVEGSATQGIVTCTAQGSVLVTVNQNPTLTATSSPTDICKGQSAVLTAGGAATYTWAVPALSTGASLTVTPAADQTYTVAGEDANGCKGSKTVAVKVSGCVGIATNAVSTANLVIYPNPSAGDFTISADQNIDLVIVNELGQLVRTISLNAGNRNVKVSNLANGVYFISGGNANGSVKQKIVVGR